MKRYNTLSEYLKKTFGERVWRVSVDLGLTCPVRDGTKGWDGCLYCNNEAFTPRYVKRGALINEQITEGIKVVGKKARKFIVYFQPYTNTYCDPEFLRNAFNKALSHPEVVGVSLGTRPDCLPDRILEVIDEFSGRTYLMVELGLQSANPKTLELINRGHTPEDFAEATRKLKEIGVQVLAHIILGLPSEGKEDWLNTGRFLRDVGVDAVKIHPLHVVKGSRLEKWYLDGRYIPLELDEYVKGAVDVLEVLHPECLIARITGEAPPNLLLAPSWCLDKNRVLKMIDGEIERRNIILVSDRRGVAQW